MKLVFLGDREFGCIVGSVVVAAHCEYRQGVPNCCCLLEGIML